MMNSLKIKKHSKRGIASFIISLVSSFTILFTMVIAWIIGDSAPDGFDQESSSAILLGAFVFISFVAAIVAFVLGISGIFLKDYKKIFSSFGILISGFIIWISFAFLILGIVSG